MPTRRFIQCDVFTPTPTLGNALAVVVDGDGISDRQMQRLAAWTNLAETTFILPPIDCLADYRLKIFSTVREMLFAGHPTLGSCAAWLHCGGKPKQAGLVRQGPSDAGQLCGLASLWRQTETGRAGAPGMRCRYRRNRRR
jgi:PhzF family phenazine biosynthesis protein